METRLILAYALLVLMAFAALFLIAATIRRRHRRRRTMRGWRPHWRGGRSRPAATRAEPSPA